MIRSGIPLILHTPRALSDTLPRDPPETGEGSATSAWFYEEHPRWLHAQVFVILLLAALGVVALFVATWLGVVLLIVSFACSIAALTVPAWRVRVEERHPEA